MLIVRVAYKVIAGQGADDSRSDDEDDEEDEVHVAEEKKALMEGAHLSAEPKSLVEKDVLSADYGSHASSRRSTRRKEGGQSSGINVLGSADRKELLGRIGWGAKATIYALIGGLACDNAVGDKNSSASPQVNFARSVLQYCRDIQVAEI